MDGCALGITRRGETTHSGVDVHNTHPSMINPLNITRQVMIKTYYSMLPFYDLRHSFP